MALPRILFLYITTTDRNCASKFLCFFESYCCRLPIQKWPRNLWQRLDWGSNRQSQDRLCNHITQSQRQRHGLFGRQ